MSNNTLEIQISFFCQTSEVVIAIDSLLRDFVEFFQKVRIGRVEEISKKIHRKRPKKKTGNVLLCLPPFFRLFMCKQISSEARKIYKSFFVCSWYDGEFNFRQNQIFKRLKEN
jgi:hypothetical protein